MNEKVLTPFIKCETPWIGNRKLGSPLQFGFLRAETIEAPINPTHGTIRSLDTGMEENTLTHHEGTGWIRSEGADRVVSIMGVKAGKHNLLGVSFIITVFIRQKHQMGLLGNVNSAGSEFETDRQIQAIRENDFFVSLSVIVGIFVNQ